jgi:hypothetical protein
MSALGQKRSFRSDQPNVRFAPIADIENRDGEHGNSVGVFRENFAILEIIICQHDTVFALTLYRPRDLRPTIMIADAVVLDEIGHHLEIA